MLDHFFIAGLVEDHIVPKINSWIYIILMMIGLYAMISKNNLIKKLIGMSIFPVRCQDDLWTGQAKDFCQRSTGFQRVLQRTIG